MSKITKYRVDATQSMPENSSKLTRRIQKSHAYLSWVTTIVAALIIVGITTISPPFAHASWHDYPENGTPGYLQLHSNPANPEWHHLNAGDEVRWAILIGLTNAAEGTLSLELQGIGELVNSNDFTIEIQSCSSEGIFIAGIYQCDGSNSTIIPEATIATIDNATPGSPWHLGVITPATAQSLEVILRLGSTADFSNQTGQIGLGITAVGDSETPIPTLPDTGSGSIFLPYLMMGLLGTGVILLSLNHLVKRSHG